MSTLAEINRYVRARLGEHRSDGARFADALRHRGVAVAVVAVCAALGALLVPGLQFALAVSLFGFVLWAAVTPLHATPSVRQDLTAGLALSVTTRDVLATSGGGASVIQALGDPALTLNRRLDVLEANAAADDVFDGVRIGRHISHTTRNPELTAAVGDALRLRQRKTFTLEMRTPMERHLEGVAAPLSVGEPTDNQAVVLVYLRDLTEQDRLAAMRADFVANASHELRTPLASLKGFIETLQGPARTDTAAHGRFLEIMNAQAERMTRLIDDLLSLSRIEMRAHIPPSTVVDLNEIAGSVVAALEPQAKLAGATVIVHPLAGGASVRGDHDELLQAVSNLVQNAIKYGRTGGTVDVRIGAGPDGRRSVSVSDDGHGIAPEHLPRLTERFYRVNVASSRDRGGTGLGLAIVKHIATRHRGALTIASKTGQGSTFEITLPGGRQS